MNGKDANDQRNHLQFVWLVLVGIGWLMAAGESLDAQDRQVLHSEEAAMGGAVPVASQEAGTSGLGVIRTARMNINYEIKGVRRDDLARVELWYGRGYEGAWQLYDYDEDRISPIYFIASGEGVFRFLVVAVDRWGRRSFESRHGRYARLPTAVPAGVAAHEVAFIDYTAPKLYLYSPRGRVEDYRDKQLVIRWAGFDAHLGVRPVRLYYQRESSDRWVPISEFLPASGEFTWQLPDRLSGSLRIRAVLTDQAGNCDVQVSGPVNISVNAPGDDLTSSHKPEEVEDKDSDICVPETGGAAVSGAEPLTVPDSAQLSEKAVRCFRRGMLYSQRLEWPQAKLAFAQALEHDPLCTEARVNLANTLYRLGQFEEAGKHFELSLQINPNRQTALFGLAQTQIALKQYDQAQRTLSKLFKLDERDWQAWLMYGDASEKLGDKATALESWRKAAEGDLASVARMARERLDNYEH